MIFLSIRIRRSLLISLSSVTTVILFLTVSCKTDGTSDVMTEGSHDLSSAGNYCTATPAALPQIPAGRSPGPTCQELVAKFPTVSDPKHPEDRRVMCPFLRILKRTGLLDAEIDKNLKSSWATSGYVAPIYVTKVVSTTPEIGCQGIACAAVAEQVAISQNSGWPALTVDIGKLFAAPPRATYTDRSKQRASHDCGYTFKFGDDSVNDQVRAATLARFNVIAGQNQGKIKLADLVQVKKEMCQRDYPLYKKSGLNPFSPVDETHQIMLPDNRDQIEVALIWAYLGGMDNGFITPEDLDRFFHASFPANKTRFFLDVKLLGDSMSAQKGMW